MSKHSLKICSVNLGDDIIDRLVKMLRTSGLPAQVATPKSGESLSEHLDKQIPDVVLVGGHGELDIAQVSSICRKRIPKVPRLLVDNISAETRNDALKFEYDDLVDTHNESWMIHCINREWERYRSLCKIDSLEIELSSLNESHSQMVASSDKGIAYVCDGLHVTCTERYAELFEYPNETDVCITPLIDLVAPEYQEEFRQMLKDFNKSDSETSTEMETTCLSAGGKPLPIRLELTKSSYDGEAAIQVAASQAARSLADNIDHSSQDFIKQLDYLMNNARKGAKPGCVICVQTWNFWQIRKKVGIIASSEVLNHYYTFLKKAAGAKITTARLGSDFFALVIPGVSTEKATGIAQQLIDNIEGHIFEVNNISLNLFSRAGIIPFDRKTQFAPVELVNLGFEAISTMADDNSDEKVRVYKAPVKPIEKAQGFDPNQTLSNLTQSGGIQVSFQPVVSLREDPFELYETRFSIADANGIEVDLNKLAETKFAKNESKLDRWLFGLALARLNKQIKKAPKTRLLISLSDQVFNDKTFPAFVLEQCMKNKVSRQQFIFQWQETSFTQRLKQAAAFTQILNKAKITYAISEYDHSLDAAKTLNLLKPRLVKIHDNIALTANENKDSAERMDTILSTAADIECAVIVPQVNSAPSLAWLWQSGAAFVQGDYIQPASPNMEFNFNDMGM